MTELRITDDPLFWTAKLDRTWRLRARCAGMDTDLFFADRGNEAKTQNAEAKAICKDCPVRFECLEDALNEPQPWFGVRGGLTAKERRRIKWRPRIR